jgi:Gpi18-like mannosyltransferase
MQRHPTRDIFWLFLTTRLLLVMITYIAYILLTAAKYSDAPVNVAALFSTWDRWDAANYTHIAQYGYQNMDDLAFFPLFPLLIAGGARLLGGGSWSYIFVGTIISNGALFGALLIIYRLAADLVGDELSHRTLLYLCIFPTAFFFFAPYNESLYLLFAAGSFLALRRQKWWLAGLLGMLAALTRSVGILLVAPYLYEMWEQRAYIRARSSTLLHSLGALLLIPLGTLLYIWYNWQAFGDPLAFVHVQSHWSRYTTWPWMGLFQAIWALFIYHPQAFGSSNQVHLLLDLTATVGFIILVIIGWRKLPKSYSIWMALFLLYILLNPAQKPDILLSNQRFILEMFPAFITLAIVGKRSIKFHYALLLLFPTLQAVMGIAFMMNHWVV